MLRSRDEGGAHHGALEAAIPSNTSRNYSSQSAERTSKWDEKCPKIHSFEGARTVTYGRPFAEAWNRGSRRAFLVCPASRQRCGAVRPTKKRLVSRGSGMVHDQHSVGARTPYNQ